MGADDDALSCLVYSESRGAELAPLGWSAAQQQAFLRMQFLAQKQHYLTSYPDAAYHLILHGEEVVGRLIVQRDAATIFILDLTLLPARRNAGIGTALLRRLQDEATAAGKPLRLHAKHAERAATLYRRLGFYPIAEDGIYWEMEWRAA